MSRKKQPKKEIVKWTIPTIDAWRWWTVSTPIRTPSYTRFVCRNFYFTADTFSILRHVLRAWSRRQPMNMNSLLSAILTEYGGISADTSRYDIFGDDYRYHELGYELQSRYSSDPEIIPSPGITLYLPRGSLDAATVKSSLPAKYVMTLNGYIEDEFAGITSWLEDRYHVVCDPTGDDEEIAAELRRASRARRIRRGY